MESNPDSTRWSAYKRWASSLPVRFAMVPLAGIGVARSEHNALFGLGAAVAMLCAVLIGLQVEDRRRRRREARAHIAGLSRW